MNATIPDSNTNTNDDQQAPVDDRATGDGAPRRDADFNQMMARLFREAAALLESQHADGYRIAAYRRGAGSLEQLVVPASVVYRRSGLAGLTELPAIGRGLGAAIADVVDHGRWRWLERLHGVIDHDDVLTTVAGIGEGLAGRIHQELGIDTLDELEAAAIDGRLARVEGFGEKRVDAVRDSLAGRRLRLDARIQERHRDEMALVSTEEILDIDAEYRERAAHDDLPLIAPRRFNPTNARWLPILHTARADRHYTAMFSNTARAHELGRTHDWVVIFADDVDHGHWTVVTERSGPGKGHRIVRGPTGPSSSLGAAGR